MSDVAFIFSNNAVKVVCVRVCECKERMAGLLLDANVNCGPLKMYTIYIKLPPVC